MATFIGGFFFCIFRFLIHSMKTVLVMCMLLVGKVIIGQSLTGTELLEKSIAYHDSNGNWPKFNGVLNVTMTSPDSPDRISKITINLPERFFQVVAKKDGATTDYIINKGTCSIAFNGKTNLTEDELKANNLS